LEEDYGTTINKVAEETLTQSKRYYEVELPSMQDIQKLYNYLKEMGCILYSNLLKSYVTIAHG